MTSPRIKSALVAATVLLAAACGGGSDPETATEGTSAPVTAAAGDANGEEGGLQSFAVDSDDAGSGDASSGGADAGGETTTTAAPEETTTTVEETTTTEAPTETIGGEVDVFSFEVGNCFSDAGGDTVDSLPLVSCAEEHSVEVYALYDLPEGDFPGQQETSDLSAEGCLERFDAYVGLAYADSVYDINTIFPTENTWNNLFDREVICLLVRIDGQPNVGSAAGSGI